MQNSDNHSDNISDIDNNSYFYNSYYYLDYTYKKSLTDTLLFLCFSVSSDYTLCHLEVEMSRDNKSAS